MTQPPLPSHASVIVIGGGVKGCSTLYHLAKAGISDCILLERHAPTSGTTWHSAAQVRALRSSRNLTDIIRYSIDLYARLEAETGQHTGWVATGSLSIATNADRLTHIRRQQGLADLFGVRAEPLSAGEAGERWPLMRTDDVIGAVWSPDDGRVGPSDLCAALLKGAKTKGARVFADTPVTGILTADGRVRGVITPQGEIACDAVAICAGLWSRRLARDAGAVAPLWPCEHFYLLTRPMPELSGRLPTLSDHDGHLYIRDEAGGLLAGCFEPLGKPVSAARLGADFAFQLLPEDWDHFEPMMENALHRVPALADAGVRMLLNGPESFTPDGTFMLGETAETRDLFLGCGMNSVGIATGGGAGMALAHCIMHGHTPTDLHEADPKRFAPEFNDARTLAARVPEVLGKHYEIARPGRQWRRARNLCRLPLDGEWRRAKARFGQFYTWERPLYFGSSRAPRLTFGRPEWHDRVRREVRIAHEAAAVFDQSGFGKIEVTGKDACRFLNRVAANRMDRAPGRVIYTPLLNPRGGIESDLIAVRLAEDHYRLYVGTASIRRDLAWLHRHCRAGEAVALRDASRDFAVLALAGPQAPLVLDRVGAANLADIGYYRAGEGVIAGHPVLAARLSITGENGWEISCRAGSAHDVYRALHDGGARPAGFYAQTAMRIEKRFPAMGHELDGDVTPLQAGLDKAVDMNKDFIGRTALLAKSRDGAANRIVSIVAADKTANPLGGEPVRLAHRIIGRTTSAAYGFRIDAPVALADIPDAASLPDGIEVTLDIASSPVAGRMFRQAAFDPAGVHMRGASSTKSSTNSSTISSMKRGAP